MKDPNDFLHGMRLGNVCGLLAGAAGLVMVHYAAPNTQWWNMPLTLVLVALILTAVWVFTAPTSEP